MERAEPEGGGGLSNQGALAGKGSEWEQGAAWENVLIEDNSDAFRLSQTFFSFFNQLYSCIKGTNTELLKVTCNTMFEVQKIN